MAIWILTIGSSDVQLDSDKISKKKGRRENQRSDKMWRNWYNDDIRDKCHNMGDELKQIDKDKNPPYRIEPRVLGTVYQYHYPQIQEEIWSYLTFPLLDTFVNRLKAETDQLDQIIVLLTDQSQIFSDYQTQRQITCPYWQDTRQLQPILDYCCTIDSEKDNDIWRFGEVTFDQRNKYFHQLFGLSEQNVFDAWDTDNRRDWEARVLGCLNFIAELDSPFTALKSASLISPIQDKLAEAIAQLISFSP